MRPHRIILIRHAETEANVDERLYAIKPDHAMELTVRGHGQARHAGESLRATLDGERTRVYLSPYVRTRQTLAGLALGDLVDRAYEEPRLREQDWGNFQDNDVIAKARRERDEFGHFYYRFPHGESGADVYDRVSTFLETLYRDFEKSHYPDNVLLVTHGLTMRLFCMRWFHWSIEFFESLNNPDHCETRVLHLVGDRYVLDQPFAQWCQPDG
jgi:broad specificity phosphatase PhoE